MRIIQFLSYLCVIYLIVPAAASAQPPVANGNSTKVVRVVRVDTPRVIDGRLDEAVWGQADVITDFHQCRAPATVMLLARDMCRCVSDLTFRRVNNLRSPLGNTFCCVVRNLIPFLTRPAGTTG
jgi:hypothetical protein